MPQVYLIARSADLQNGSVMVTDLFPNESQRNTALEPQAAGPIYVRQIDSGLSGAYRSVLAVDGNGNISFMREARGLVAYLLYNVQNGNGGPALTLDQAKGATADLIAEVRAGNTLELADINAILAAQAGAAGATLTGNASTGSVSGVLRVLAGESYVVPASAPIEIAGVFVPDANADEIGFQRNVRHPVDGDSSWEVSFSEGSLGGLVDRQLVSVYVNDGTLHA